MLSTAAAPSPPPFSDCKWRRCTYLCSQRKDTCPHNTVTLATDISFNSSLLPSLESLGRTIIGRSITKATPAIPALRNHRTSTLAGSEATAIRRTIRIASAGSGDELRAWRTASASSGGLGSSSGGLGSSSSSGGGSSARAAEAAAAVALLGDRQPGAFTGVEAAAAGGAVGVAGAGAGYELGALGAGEEGYWQLLVRHGFFWGDLREIGNWESGEGGMRAYGLEGGRRGGGHVG